MQQLLFSFIIIFCYLKKKTRKSNKPLELSLESSCVISQLFVIELLLILKSENECIWFA